MKLLSLEGGGALQSAPHYRRRAAELRAEANKTRHDDIKQQLLVIAAQYEELADMVEQGEFRS